LSKLPNFRISCLKRVRDVSVDWNATHVVSLLDPDIQVEDIPKFPDGVEHRCFFFYDEDDSPDGSEFGSHLESVLGYLHAGPLRDASNRLVVHCHAGASRSPALFYILQCQELGPGREHEAFGILLKATVKPWPNRQLVAVADEMLGRDGKMLGPLDAYRLQYPKRIEAYRRLNAKRGIPSKRPLMRALS
jgi:predicted protein tyrosine phosphatase